MALDKFVHYLYSKCSQFEQKFPSEYQILKAFDDAFWINYNNKEDGEFKPAKDNNGKIACPFNAMRAQNPFRLSMRIQGKVQLLPPSNSSNSSNTSGMSSPQPISNSDIEMKTITPQQAATVVAQLQDMNKSQ